MGTYPQTGHLSYNFFVAPILCQMQNEPQFFTPATPGYPSVDSRNFKKWGRSPTTTQKCGGGAKNSGGRLYDKVQTNEKYGFSLFRHF